MIRPQRLSIAVRWRAALLLAALVAIGLGVPAAFALDAPAPSPNAAGRELLAHPSAQALQQCDGEVAAPRKLVLDCRPGFATDHDRLIIYLATPVQASAMWQDAVSTTDAVWVFEPGAQGTARLVIDFHQERSGLVASFYTDVDGDGTVGVAEQQDGSLRVTELLNTPSVEMTAPDGWWTQGDRTNFNLNLRIDGPIIGMQDAAFLLADMRTDTRTDLEVFVRDPENSGRPQYEWRQAYPPGSRSDGTLRTVVLVNPRNEEPPITGAWGWPYLMPGPPRDAFVKPYLFSPPPLQIDWETARVRQIGEFVASRGGPNNWFLNSIMRVGAPGEWPDLSPELANFESPFAFYDMAGRGDGYHDTVVRFSYFFPHDPYFRLGRFGSAVTQVDFSWLLRRQEMASVGPEWDYKVSVAGNHIQDGVVQLPEFKVRVVPYEQAPGWVAERTWPVATFVAREGEGYNSNEGLYEWYPLEGSGEDGYDYVTGSTATPPAGHFREIPEGYRGEAAFDLTGSPLLYISPVDQRLHLYGAESGVWQQDSTRTLRYQARDGSPVINRWAAVVEGEERETLAVLPGYLVYSSDEGVTVREAAVPPLQWLRPLPASREAWQAYANDVPEIDPPGSVPTLRRDFDRFSGADLALPGVTLLEATAPGAGVRLVVEAERAVTVELPPLPAATEPEGEAAARTLELPAGLSAVQIVRGSDPAVTAARPAAVQVVRLDADSHLRESTVARVRAELQNEGDVGVAGEVLTWTATGPSGQAVTLGETAVDLRAGASVTVEQAWTPDAPGDWTLRVEGAGVSAALPVRVEPLPVVGPDRVLAASGLTPAYALRVLAMAALVVVLPLALFGGLLGAATGGRTRRPR